MTQTLVGLWRPSTAMRRCRMDVAAAFGVTVARILGPSRHERVCSARFALAWVLRARWPRISPSQIAFLMGVSDHSTAIHALKRAGALRAECQVFHATSEALATGRYLPEAALPARIARRYVRKDDPQVEAEWRELLRPERLLNASDFNGPPRLSADEIEARRREGERTRQAHVAYWLAREKPALGRHHREMP